MKLLITTFLFALAWQAVKPQCSEVEKCNSCSNPAPFCDSCPFGFVLSVDRQSCLSCNDVLCSNCTANADDTTTCTGCSVGSYLDTSAACVLCGDGCLDCAINGNGLLECLECMDEGWVQDVDTDGTPCLQCPTNCVDCKIENGATVCTKCRDNKDNNRMGYFLKTSDKSCKSCNSRASSCGSDDGTGNAPISQCFSDYEVESVDKKKCLACPAECATCSGTELNGKATCESCVPDMGNFLVAGECIPCADQCVSCEDDAMCAECMPNYRVDGGSCSECQINCRQCSVNTVGDELCDECVSGYGPKEATSVTCDSCKISNCKTCSILSSGDHSCTLCATGFGIFGGQCKSCGAGCSACEEVVDAVNGNFLTCTACTDGYSTASTVPVAADATFAAPGVCQACTRADPLCTTCTPGADAATNPTCTGCQANNWWDGLCKPNDVPNCAEYDAVGACTSCMDGFKDDGAGACEPCTGTNCKTCDANAAYCAACFVGASLFDSDADTNNEECRSCGIGNCDACEFSDPAAPPVTTLCNQCKTGYTPYDADTSSTTKGKSCKKCPTGCDACTYDYANNAAVCTAGTCATGYIDGETGQCAQCPADCTVCTYLDGVTACTTCSGALVVNGNGECEACPEFCASCTYDSTESAVVCSAGSCISGYGLISGGKCAACPGNCKDCSVRDTTNAPDTLTCDTCKDAYAKNDKLCGACSANCIECVDNGGTMDCAACKSGYALDSVTKECVKCLANCLSCTSSSGVVKCTECGSGYSLSLDKLTCLTCNEAAFDNCILCGDVQADTLLAECDACRSDYALENLNPAGPCIDVSFLDCSNRIDRPAMCDDCVSEDYMVSDMGECYIQCYKCGDFATEEYVSQANCKIPNNTLTDTGSEFAKLEKCTRGICLSYFMDGNVIAGCAPEVDMEGNEITCPDGDGGAENKQVEWCGEKKDLTRCEQCCEDANKCNTFVTTMDGVAGAATCTINLLMLGVAALLAIFRTN